jgi:PadR family transcriptional regulator, regulatory protein PadR
MAQTNPNFMNGVPELLILRLLADREMYGYELVSSIRDATGSEFSIGEGVVYPVLHTLERGKHLASRRVKVDGRTRVYYRLTAKGKRRLKSASDDWQRITGIVASVLQGGLRGRPIA